MLSKKWISTSAGALLFTSTLLPAAASAQNEVALERIEAHAQNKPLRSLAEAAENARFDFYHPGPPREVPNFRGGPEPGFDATGDIAASATQTGVGTDGAIAVGTGFPGAENNDNGSLLGFLIAPPDTDGHVGPNHYVQMINLLTTIYDKNGNVVQSSFPSNAFWSGIGGNCEPHNQGDPVVLYDDQADRWLVSQFAFPDSLSSFSQCVAVSVNGDPTGAYHRYEFSFDGIGLNDYPKHGIVDGSITMIANLFKKRGGGPFAQFSYAGTFLGAMDKAAMYAGSPASLLGQNVGTGEFGFLAGDLDGPGTAPPLFATAMSNSSSFDIWEANVDWASQSFSVGRIAQIPVSPFDADLCSASREACIPQPGNGPALEAITDRLMHRLQIRDFGSYKTMVTAHTVDVGGGRAGIRWYEMRDSGSGWSLYQEGTYGPDDTLYRWMPSAAMNAGGDIGIGFLVANSTDTYVSTAVTGQTAASSGTGLFDAPETVCAYGTGVQLNVNRSGDYSSTSVDESSGAFWHTNEVFLNTGQFQWSTWVCEFTVSGGGTPNTAPVASFSYSCPDSTCDFTDTSTDSDGSVTAWSWDFGDGASSSAQNPSHTYTSSGSYTVTLTVTDDDGATDAVSNGITVTVVNVAPTASFTSSCTDLECSFSDTSSDSDGTVTSWDWNFGDGTTSTAQNPSHTYASGNSYIVTLTVTDDDGATSDSASQQVTVTEPAAISLAASGYKDRGRHNVDLIWSGANSNDVDIYRDGTVITTTANDGAYSDNIGTRGGATYIYKVCEAGTETCSANVAVVF